MLASSFLDPVLGLDIHFEMVPTPAPVPTPIPNPFIGIVFDPIGLAAGIALGAAIGAVMGAPFQGPVLYWTAFPATNTGTEAKAVPGHILIPPGVAWAPFPKTPKPVIHPGETPKPGLPIKPEDDAVVVFGSKTVTVMGSNAVRLGDIALSCSEPLRLPSSVVLAVPKGALILIGGPPSLDIMAAVLASLRTRFVSDSLHALLSRMKPSRFRNFLHRVVCFFTGHPVDVASGKVMTEFVDAELPGPMPLRIERIYSSAFASRKGPLGHGWSLSLDQAIWRERGKVVFLAEDGREIEFDTFDFEGHQIRAGESVYHPIERLTLHCDPGGAWRVVDHDGVARTFTWLPGARDRAVIQKITSRCRQHEIIFHYHAGTTRLEWVRDTAGRYVQLTHDAEGRVVGLHLPQPDGSAGAYAHRRYEYDLEGNLKSVTDAIGHAWRFEYTSHLLTREVDRNGLAFHFAYDGIGEDAWCVRTWGDDGIFDHVLSYDKANRLTCVTDSRGFVTRYHMNLVGQVVTIVDPLGAEVHYEYDSILLAQTKHIDALGRVTTTGYDARGSLVARTLPGGMTFAFEYDSQGLLVRAATPRGRETRWVYDGLGRTIERSATAELDLRYEYEGGRPVRMRRADGLVVEFVHDGQGLLSELRSPLGTGFRWRHDALGRCIEESEIEGASTRYWYDANGHVVASRELTGDAHQLTRDPEGGVVRSRTSTRDVQFTRVARGLIAARHEAGTTREFEYDAEGRVTVFRDEQGGMHRFELDARGDVVVESNPSGARRHYRRDAAGRAVEILRPGDRWTRLEYDDADHVTKVEYWDGTREEFEYGSDGLLSRARNATTTVSFERDQRGRVIREMRGDDWIDSVHDPAGPRVALTSSRAAKQRLFHDALGRFVGLDTDGWASRIRRDVGGHVVERSMTGGVRSTWTRDTQGRPLWHRVLDPRGLACEMGYEWGWTDRLQRVLNLRRGVSWSHGYDPRGILTWVDDGERHELRMPDALGNLHASTTLDDRRYGPAGELLARRTADGEETRLHCAEGNLVERRTAHGETWRYRWNAAGLLAAVERPDGEVVAFGYDALGRRVSKTSASGTTHWLWDGHVPLHEWRAGEASITWVFEPGRHTPTAKLVGEEAWSIIHDHLDVPVMMFDAEGREVWSAEHGIRGDLHVVVAAPGFDRTSCPFRWPGQYEDVETGLYYNRFRYYDCEAGLYISPDPLRNATRNRTPYAYVDDPLTEIDPLGLNKAFWRLFDSGGSEVGSGTVVPDAGAKSIPGRVGDSEQKILRQLESEIGDGLAGSRLVIESQPTFIKVKGKTIPIQGIKPCDFCDPAMEAFAKKHGMTIEYKYRGNTVTYPKENPSCP